TGSRVGAVAEHQSHVWWPDALVVHVEGPAGDAARPPATRCPTGWLGVLPPRVWLQRDDTHRLIPTKYVERQKSVLLRLADDSELDRAFEIDNLTNDRLAGEGNELPGISVHALVFGVPHDRIINAAFTYAHPHGSRFNGSDRGAWYAGFEFETSCDEVAYHFREELRE